MVSEAIGRRKEEGDSLSRTPRGAWRLIYFFQDQHQTLARAWRRCIGEIAKSRRKLQEPTSFVERINLVWYMDTDA